MVLPVVKLATLALKTACKPIANRLKKEAGYHPKFRSFIIAIARSHFPFSRSHVSSFRFHTHTCFILCCVWLWFFLGSGQSQIDDDSAEKNLWSCHWCCNPSFERGEGCASCCRFARRTLRVLGNDNIMMLFFLPLLPCSFCVTNCLQPVCVFYCLIITEFW